MDMVSTMAGGALYLTTVGAFASVALLCAFRDILFN